MVSKVRHSVVALLAAFAIVGAGLVVAACGSDDNDSESQGSSQAASTQESSEQSDLKVAMLLPVPLNSPGFGESFAPAAEDLEGRLGDNFSVVDSVEASDYQSTLSQFGEQGYDLVIITSAVFESAAKQVAPRFPDTNYAIMNGFTAVKPNISGWQPDFKQAGYLTGMAASYATTSNKIGAVAGTIGGVKLPAAEALNDGYEAGIEEFNPEAEVTISYIGTYDDPGQAAAATRAQIAKGIDVIWADAAAADSGIFKAAQAADKLAIGYGSDSSALAPKNTLTSTLVDYPKIIEALMEELEAGSLTAKVYKLPFSSGTFGLAPIENVDEETKTKITETLEEYESGEREFPAGL